MWSRNRVSISVDVALVLALSDAETHRFEFHPALQVRPVNSTDSRSREKQAGESRLVYETLLIMTGGCEVCVHAAGPFCKKHGHPVKPGDPRCVDFARPSSEDLQRASKARSRSYMYEHLGIRGESLDRLSGRN